MKKNIAQKINPSNCGYCLKKDDHSDINTNSASVNTVSTIAACSTGFPGAIAVIRLSGQKTKSLLKQCFYSKMETTPRFVATGKIDTGDVFDTATAVFFKAPDSYTGEDMAEISIHANPVLAEKLLVFLMKNGAEPAQRGEFTYRAFLNGKMDLTAAEAVADIIRAESEAEIKYAYRQMKGELRKKIDLIQNELNVILAGLNAAIDFPEENIEDTILSDSEANLKKINIEIKKLLDSYKSGRFIKNGVRATIIGGVNVGKSSLLNALLKKERAIVTDIAGTTRDTLEDRFEYNGQKFIIVDTAGIRKSKDKIEKEGIERTKKAADECDVIIAVTEAAKSFDKQIAELLEKLKTNGKKVILVENKTDIASPVMPEAIALSAKTGQNIDTLKQELFKVSVGYNQIDNNNVASSGTNHKEIANYPADINSAGSQKENQYDSQYNNQTVTVTELRHYQALIKAGQFLYDAEKSIKTGCTADLVASDFMSAYNELGRITGKTASDEIIDTIFSRFCVGK